MNTPLEPQRPASLDVPANVQRERQRSDGNRSTPPYRSIIVIGSVLMAWAGLLALGAIWASDNYLKAIVIVGSMGCFPQCLDHSTLVEKETGRVAEFGSEVTVRDSTNKQSHAFAVSCWRPDQIIPFSADGERRPPTVPKTNSPKINA